MQSEVHDKGLGRINNKSKGFSLDGDAIALERQQN